MALTCQPPWWAYVFIAPCVFVLFLFLNYIVNKINAARIEERYAQFIAKDSSHQGTQAQPEKMMRMETPKRTKSSPACLRSKSPIKKRSSVISSPKVRKTPSNPIFSREVYSVQLANSSKSIEKNVILNQEALDNDVNDAGNEIVSETSKKAKDCESAPAFKRMMNDQTENKLRDCVSDTTVTIYNKEIKKDTEL